MPATDNESTSWTRAVEHLLDALLSDAFWQDAEGVHAHACEFECIFLPEFMRLFIEFIFNHFVEFHGIAL